MKDIKELEQFLIEFNPMIEGVKRRLSRKWFALESEEIGSLVNLAIQKLWRKNKNEVFVLTKKTLTIVAERAIIKQICREPSVEVHISEDENGKRTKLFSIHQTMYLDAEVEEGLTLLDMVRDETPTIEEQIEKDEELEEKKGMVLAIISERTYKQLCFEYDNKCVSQEHLNLIQKIKKEIEKL